MSKKYTEEFENSIKKAFSVEHNTDREKQKSILKELALNSPYSEKELAAKLRHLFNSETKSGNEVSFIYHAAEPYVRKDSTPVELKATIVQQIEKMMGAELPSLENCTRADLVTMRSFIVAAASR